MDEFEQGLPQNPPKKFKSAKTKYFLDLHLHSIIVFLIFSKPVFFIIFLEHFIPLERIMGATTLGRGRGG